MDASSVFKLAGQYRKKPNGMHTITAFQEDLPISDIERIEFYLDAIRFVQSYRFEKINPLSQWEGTNVKQAFADMWSFIKNEKIVWNKLYAVAASYLIKAGWNRVFENVDAEDIIAYFKWEKTVDDLYKGNQDAFDFVGKSGEWYSFPKINNIYTIKGETVNDIWEGMDIEDENEIEIIEKIQAIPEVKKQRLTKCAFIIYLYYKKLGDPKAEEAYKKVLDKLNTDEE